jgi:RNA polymerase sigma factor (sigma-70 family)
LHVTAPEALDAAESSFPDPQAAAELAERIEDMMGRLARLPSRYRKVIEDRFFHSRTQSAIGQELGVTHERVRQIEGRALAQLAEMN